MVIEVSAKLLHARDQHLLVLGDARCGKTTLLRGIVQGAIDRYSPEGEPLPAALVTDRVRLGTFVSSPNYRHPYLFLRDLLVIFAVAEVLPGDPGAETSLLFHPAVYNRGAMTLHALRQVVGDTAFFQVLREWADTRAGEAVTTVEFVALAEEVAGRDLGDLFQAWLYTPERPALG